LTSISLPTLPGVREAPITAIDLGYKRNSNIIQNTTKSVIGDL